MRLTREQKQEKAVEDLINQMFIIAGHDVRFDDIKTRKDNWFQQYTMTMAQNEEWQKWGKKYLQTNLRARAKMAEKEMQWFSLQYGLKFSFQIWTPQKKVKITMSYFRKVYKDFLDEKITMSRMVELLNEKLEEDVKTN
jgi:hypothetical protein